VRRTLELPGRFLSIPGEASSTPRKCPGLRSVPVQLVEFLRVSAAIEEISLEQHTSSGCVMLAWATDLAAPVRYIISKCGGQVKTTVCFIILFSVAAASKSSSLWAQGCFQYSFTNPAPNLACGAVGVGDVCAPASGSQTTTYIQTGTSSCSSYTTTTTTPQTVGNFVQPGRITNTFGTIPLPNGDLVIPYANNVVPNLLLVCNGQLVTQGTGQVSYPATANPPNPPEAYTSTISGTILTEANVSSSKTLSRLTHPYLISLQEYSR
jgi:hypothetical protein